MANDDLPETEADLRPIEAPRSTRLAARYSIGRQLGEGGMGEVLACRDVILDRTVALKIVRRDREAKHFEARFVREARVQAQLEHPGVVPVFDVGRDENGSAYFTMRKVGGKTLDELISTLREGRPNPAFNRHQLLSAFAQVCLTVDYAHARGVLHRDLKPANIMLGEFGEVYVLDWGLAKVAIESTDDSEAVATPPSALHTAAGTTMGTPAYMAPEQLAGLPLDARADVFALGAILFEIVTLEPLLDGVAIQCRLGRHEGTWDSRPSVRAPARNPAPEFDLICQRATSADREKRYRTARALSDAVEAYLQGERDAELRQAKAAQHVAEARAVVADDRDGALVLVNRALALAPEEPEALALLVDILSSTPVPTPEDRADVAKEQIARLRNTQPLGAFLFVLPWLTIYPIVAFLRGVRSIPIALVPPALWLLAGLGIMVDHRSGTHARVRYPMILVMLATASSTLVVGPFFILPCLAGTAVASHVMVGARVHQRTTILCGVAALVVPSVLSWAGIDPVYRFISDDSFEIRGIFRVVHNAPGLGVLLTGVHLILLVGVSLYASQFRDAIDAARTEKALFAWQLSKLLPTVASVKISSPTDPAPKTWRGEAGADTELDGTEPVVPTSAATIDDDTGRADPLSLEGPRYDVTGGRDEGGVCRDRLIGRDVTMKRAEGDRSGFVREALLQARLDHPNIPSVYDASDEWMTMRRPHGHSLADLSRGSGSRHRLLAAFAKVCLTVDFAHAAGIAHRALGSESIILGDFGEVWVVDWSQARTIAEGEDDALADLRALGAIMLEILDGYGLETPPELRALVAKADAGLVTARELHDDIDAHLGADRDEALRRSLAERHLVRAQRRIERVLVEHQEGAREDALHELGRAIALAPDRGPALAQLSRLLESPPPAPPAPVVAQVDGQTWDTAQGAAPTVALALALAWVVVYPFYLWWIGVRQIVPAASVSVAWGVTALSIWIYSKWVPASLRLDIPAVLAMIAVATTSFLFGPFLFLPTAALAAVMGFIVGSRAGARRLIVTLAIAAVLIPSALSIAGYFPVTEFQTAGPVAVVVVRGAVRHPPGILEGAMLLANLGALLLAALYAARFREVLDDVESSNRARLKQLSRLLS